MTAESDKIIDQQRIDAGLAPLNFGDTYTLNNISYVYKDYAEYIVDLIDNYPEFIHANNCIKIIDGNQPKTTQVIRDATRLAIASELISNPVVNSALKELSNFGVSKALGAVTSVLDNFKGSLPKGNPANVVNTIKTDVAKVQSFLTNPTAAIPLSIAQNLLAGVAAGGAAAAAMAAGPKFPDEIKKLINAAGNPKEFAAIYKSIATQFPELDIDKALKVALLAMKAGKTNSLNAILPSMIAGKLASLAVSKLLSGMGTTKVPKKEPEKEPKVKKTEKPKKLIQQKNLFASVAAGAATGAGAASGLLAPISQIMNYMSTVKPETYLITPSPEKTSAGDQKLNGTANTASFGSGQNAINITEEDRNIQKILELAEKIEQLAAEINLELDDFDLDRILSKDEAFLKSIYPEYNEQTTLIEIIQAVKDYEERTGTTI